MLFEQGTKKYRPSFSWAFIAATMLASPLLQAQTRIEPPKIIESSSDHGLAQPLQQATVTVHLKLHNEDAYDKAIEALYTPGSSTYHHWLTKSDLAKYSPTQAEVATVKKELESHGLSILSVDSNNSSIRARGSISSLEDTFQTRIHEFEKDGKTFYANITPAALTGTAGGLVHSISGLTNFKLKPLVKFKTNPRTGKQLPMIPLGKLTATGLGQYFTNDCFKSPAAVSLTTYGSALPVGQFFGNLYDQGTLTCGWTPAQVQAHYGLTAAYKAGLDGTGQTIVIVDGPSDPTIKDDLVAFSKLTGLPAPTASNFEILYPDGKPSSFELNFISNWDVETDLDTQWVHSIAPKAKIIVLIMPTEDWTEFEFALQYATDNKLGNVITNSYGYPEAAWGAYTLKGFDQVLKSAAGQGVAVDFSSGDGGDEGLGAPNIGGASYPASSAYATSIGGTSIGIPNGSGGTAEVGWGNNGTFLSFETDFVLDPPEPLGSLGGSGGGGSIFIPKPFWQKSLPGAIRQQPDISAFADPYTGAIIVVGGEIGSVGGTSLASPVFSAIWALADQKAGVALGQAGPLIANLPAGSVLDVAPVSSPTNPAGIIFDSGGATYYSSDALLAPLYTTTKYFSSLWNLGDGEYVDLSFGTDTSLTVKAGWDNVTGWGVPNGLKFINAAAALK